MNPLEFVHLHNLMEITNGRREIVVGLIDGPVAVDHPDLATANIQPVSSRSLGTCKSANSAACMHGTFVAGLLAAKKGSSAPGICRDCTLLLRPIFFEDSPGTPRATPKELASAIIEMVDAGARIVNMSVSVANSSPGEHQLEEALDYATSHGVITVAAAGNQGTMGDSVITRHPWVIPVVACDIQGRPSRESNLSVAIGKRGLRAPGESIVSLASVGRSQSVHGTSAATPFVTGAIALLWSEFRAATAWQIKGSLAQSHITPRKTIVPPPLNAWAAYHTLSANLSKGQHS
jgi:subtilisin family serine protease